MQSSRAHSSSSAFISNNKKWDFGRLSHLLKVTQLKSSSSSSSQSLPSSESLFVNYSVPYTAHREKHRRHSEDPAQSKKQTQDSNSTLITPSSILLLFSPASIPLPGHSKANLGFWRKVLTRKIDGDS